MYSRSYYSEGGKINLPENYDGTAFLENHLAEEEDATEVSFIEKSAHSSENKEKQTEDAILSGIGGVPILPGLFGKGGLFGSLNLKMPKIGTEEILIIATAAFLFFSKDGDKESALILLLLLLIS